MGFCMLGARGLWSGDECPFHLPVGVCHGRHPTFAGWGIHCWVHPGGAESIRAHADAHRSCPHGLLQTVADMIRLMMKEVVRPARADRVAFNLGPLLTAVPAVMSFVVLPLGAGVVARDLNVGVLYFLAVPSISVVGLVMAGWASYDNYSFLGGLRAAAQFISYEIPRTLSVVGVVVVAGTLSTVRIMEVQTIPYAVLLPVGFVVYLITSVAELNRGPFDIPEAESEIVAGFHTEYSGLRWSLFFMAEYGGMFAASAFATVLFLGGGAGPLLPGFAWFWLKTLALVFVLMWVRWTLPRFRADQLMALAWKGLLPAALINLGLAFVVLFLVR